MELILRKFEEEDRDKYESLVFNYEVMKMNYGRVFTEEESEFIFGLILKENQEAKSLGYYKVFYLDDFIGMGVLNENDDFDGIEVQYMLLPEYWNKGFGTRLLELLMEYSMEIFPNMDIIAIIDVDNIFSKKMLVKKGFVFEKRYVNPDGDLVEVYKYQKKD